MENIYVIKVKTKPSLSSLYPSERRYSASTVGGLSFVHFGLGALSLFLGTLALSPQGPVLSVACLCPFATGLLAWKRWYIDRNIALFFYANIFSLLVGTLCFVVTVSDVAAVSENSGIWSLDGVLESPAGFPSRRKISRVNDSREESTLFVEGTREASREALDESLETFTAGNNVPEEIFREAEDSAEASANFDFENQGFKDFSGSSLNYDDLKAEASAVYRENRTTSAHPEENTKHLEGTNGADKSPETIESRILSYWRNDNAQRSKHTTILLNANVLIASLLEILWSLLSARIAFRGMQNHLLESSYEHNVATGSKLRGKMSPKKKAPAPKPDILLHDQKLPEGLRNLNGIEHLPGLGPGLPLSESNREFRERVERFLANQAVHRAVEGSAG